VSTVDGPDAEAVSTPPRCVLLVEEGPLAGRRLEVRSKLEIGRQGTGCALDDEQVSRRHAVVRVGDDDVVIEDLGSTNGTWVNRLRIDSPVALHDGDVVRVGTTTLAVQLPPHAAVAPRAKADAEPEHEATAHEATALRCTLVVKDGPLAGLRLDVESKLEIGRQGTGCTLEDTQVSRRHAVVRIAGDDVVIEDLGSTNGTWVNRLRIDSPVALHDDDIIRVGTTTLGVELPAAGPAVIGPPAPASGHSRAFTDYPASVGGPLGANGPTEPQGMPIRARRSIIGTALIVVFIVVVVAVLLVLLGGK
jgi:pSer/pThr/pTyr-binding forkhead associated (FHA) protein